MLFLFYSRNVLGFKICLKLKLWGVSRIQVGIDVQYHWYVSSILRIYFVGCTLKRKYLRIATYDRGSNVLTKKYQNKFNYSSFTYK